MLILLVDLTFESSKALKIVQSSMKIDQLCTICIFSCFNYSCE